MLRKPQRRKAEKFFRKAKSYVARKYRSDLKEFRRINVPETFLRMRQQDFLWNYAWVVYATGYRETNLDKKFPAIEKAFKGFKLEEVANMGSLRPVLKVFNNKSKATGVRDGARAISKEGFGDFKQRMLREGPSGLEELPWIGPITKNHLAGNIGLADVPKCDHWIMRIARLLGYRPLVLIDELSGKFKENKRVVDLILWGYCVKFGSLTSLRSYVASL
jgi:hypothetical protein